jgi:hypothetical protein
MIAHSGVLVLEIDIVRRAVFSPAPGTYALQLTLVQETLLRRLLEFEQTPQFNDVPVRLSFPL